MSYTTMKQKKRPPHYGKDMGMSKLEIAELVALTLMTLFMGAGAIAFIINAIETANSLII